jgi:hypothetical protein
MRRIGGQVLFCHRIAKSGEERYPPLVHILVAGYPACRFTTDAPIDRPIDQWHGRDEVEDYGAEITARCEMCYA